MTRAITQAVIEPAKATIRESEKAETSTSKARKIQVTLRMVGLTLKQPKFDWKAPDKYHKLCNLKQK